MFKQETFEDGLVKGTLEDDVLYKYYIDGKTVIYDDASFMVSIVEGKLDSADWYETYLETSVYDVELADDDLDASYADLIKKFKEVLFKHTKLIDGEGNDVTPKAEDIAVKANDVAPKAEDIAVKANDVAPKVEDIAVKGDDVKAEADDVAPKVDDIAPESNDDDAVKNEDLTEGK